MTADREDGFGLPDSLSGRHRVYHDKTVFYTNVFNNVCEMLPSRERLFCTSQLSASTPLQVDVEVQRHRSSQGQYFDVGKSRCVHPLSA